MNQVILVALGGALGSVLRFLFSKGVHELVGRGFPWGTLFVNVTGSFIMGALYVLLVERSTMGPEWRAFMMVGIMGGYTTFSSFSIETMNLIEGGDVMKALLNVAASIIVCLIAVWGGMILGRQV